MPASPAGSVRAAPLLAVLLLAACQHLYSPQPVAANPPDSAPDIATVDGTGARISVLCYNTPQTVHAEFSGEHGLWRGHVVTVQLTVSSGRTEATDLLIQSAYLSLDGKYYPAISPKEVYDVAWPASHPLTPLKQDVYDASVLGFTVFTLGLGQVVWVLPSPFAQPAPETTPFGRDLDYKALTKNISLQPGSFRSGFLFFHVPRTVAMRHLGNAQLVLHLVTKTPHATSHRVAFNLPSAGNAAH